MTTAITIQAAIKAAGKTAIKRKTASKPLRRLIDAGVFNAKPRTLDYGCGHGADVRHLRKAGVDAHGFDPVHMPHMPPKAIAGFDVVTMTYVLNVLPTDGMRRRAIEGALVALKPGGHMLITVRNDVENGGYSSRGTFQGRADVGALVATFGLPAFPVTENANFSTFLIVKGEANA